MPFSLISILIGACIILIGWIGVLTVEELCNLAGERVGNRIWSTTCPLSFRRRIGRD